MKVFFCKSMLLLFIRAVNNSQEHVECQDSKNAYGKIFVLWYGLDFSSLVLCISTNSSSPNVYRINNLLAIWFIFWGVPYL